MKNKTNTGVTVKLRRGFASAVLLATLATQAIPLTQVSASTLDYSYTETPYKTADTAQYVIDINPMIGAGQVGAGDTKADFVPQGGTYSVQRIARYTVNGERIEVNEAAQTVTLTPDDNNQILVDGDGEYRITPAGRIPGFLKDLGSTTEVDAVGEEQTVEAQGHYIYSFPLINAGVPSAGQEVDFQPKLREARTDLEIVKMGDDQTTPLAGVTFSVYKTYDAQLDEAYVDGAEKIGEATTGADGRVTFTDLIEGDYYFVEEGAVPDRYLPDSRQVEFSVQVEEDEEGVVIATEDADDVSTVGNNIRGSYEVEGSIVRHNYVDPAQNKEQTFQSALGNYSEVLNTTQGLATGNNEGIVYVNTTGEVEYSSSVDIPKNFNDYEDFSVVDTINEKLSLREGTVAVRVVTEDGESASYSVADLGGDVTIAGGEITVNAKGGTLSKILEADGVDFYVLSYTADVDTNEIAENVQYETLETTQTITADSSVTDGDNPSATTTHATEVRVQEGKIVVDKDASDGQQTPLEGAEFQLYRPVAEGETAELENDGIGWVKASNPRGENANYIGTTDANGQLEFENLPYGEYLLRETKAPEGYRLNNQPTRVTVSAETVSFDDADNTVVSTITNMRRTQIFPGTGTTGNIVILATLVTATGALAYITVKKRKDSKGDTTQA